MQIYVHNWLLYNETIEFIVKCIILMWFQDNDLMKQTVNSQTIVQCGFHACQHNFHSIIPDINNLTYATISHNQLTCLVIMIIMLRNCIYVHSMTFILWCDMKTLFCYYKLKSKRCLIYYYTKQSTNLFLKFLISNVLTCKKVSRFAWIKYDII